MEAAHTEGEQPTRWREVLPGEVMAAAAVTLVGIPQCVAYAMIAGLPPAMGLYAATAPALIGSLARSSRHVITGPSNAVSLLVGAGIGVMTGHDPVMVAVTLALMVGVIQTLAGALRLGAVVDFISNPVVIGYITGAAVLIAVGQLPNVTGSPGARGDVLTRMMAWGSGLGQLNLASLALAAGTVVVVLGLRRLAPKLPGPLLALALATGLSAWLDLPHLGVATLEEMAPIPSGLPPLTLPDLSLIGTLLPLSVAASVLSLVESSSVARAIAGRSGQRLDISREFVGQGLANLSAAFIGGYPVSGSLSRSALNEQAGARTALSGALSGVMTLLVVLAVGPVINMAPLAALAGILLLVAWDLIDWGRLGKLWHSRGSDRAAFVGTLLGTWTLPLDQAIYLGVGISLILFLRKARLLHVRELALDVHGRMREIPLGADTGPFLRCVPVHLLHVEGRLFFASASELRAALERAAAAPGLEVLIVRLKRTRGLDATTAAVIEEVARQMARRGQHLLLAGVRPEAAALLERTGAADVVGHDHIFPTRPRWFASMRHAISAACDLASDPTRVAPLRQYLARRQATDPLPEEDVAAEFNASQQYDTNTPEAPPTQSDEAPPGEDASHGTEIAVG